MIGRPSRSITSAYCRLSRMRGAAALYIRQLSVPCQGSARSAASARAGRVPLLQSTWSSASNRGSLPSRPMRSPTSSRRPSGRETPWRTSRCTSSLMHAYPPSTSCQWYVDAKGQGGVLVPDDPGTRLRSHDALGLWNGSHHGLHTVCSEEEGTTCCDRLSGCGTTCQRVFLFVMHQALGSVAYNRDDICQMPSGIYFALCRGLKRLRAPADMLQRYGSTRPSNASPGMANAITSIKERMVCP